MTRKATFGSSKHWYVLFLLLLCLINVKTVRAQNFDFPSIGYQDSIKLSDIVLTPGPDTVVVTQGDFYSMNSPTTSRHAGDFVLKSLHALVSFKMDVNAAVNAAAILGPGGHKSFHYLVVYRTIGISNPDDTTNEVVSSIDTMSVNYDTYTNVLTCDNSYKLIGNFNRIKIVIYDVYDMNLNNAIGTTAVQPNHPLNPAEATGVPDFIYFLGEILVQKYTYPSQKTIQPSYIHYNDSIAADGTVKLNWTQNLSTYKPAAYEVEWTYNEDPNQDAFRHNATRIYTNNTYFNIPVAQKQGVLWWRVRMIRPSLNDFTSREYGPWTTPQSLTINSSNHDSLNWDLKVSFVEDGKYKQNITYYDGLLKPKQTQTRLNTNPSNTIIGQSLFDYEGRPVIQSLPIPVQNRKYFAYIPNFLRPAGKPEYLKSMYDALPDTASCPGGEIPIPPLDDTAFSNQYYSRFNPNKGGHNGFIPDAEGYPLTRKILAAENPERVLFEGRAGATLQLGNERETAYLYGTPLQAELNKYFGQDIGKYNYYRKTITTDNHDQDMFSITDDEGRPVATGLTNTPDTNTLALSVRDLPANDSFKSNLLPVPDTKLGLEWENNGSHFVSVESNYGLSYGIKYKPFRPCPGLDYGLLPKVYFNYEIFDNCGNLKLQDSGVLGHIGYDTSSVLAHSKDTGNYFEKGNYVWAKRSYVKIDDIRASVDSLFDSRELCYHPFEYFLNEEVKRAKFPCPSSNDPCEGLRFAMMRDMYPGAKYGTYEYKDSTTKAFEGPGHNSIFSQIDGLEGYLYQNSDINYPNPVYAGNVAYTPNDIRSLTPQQFIDIFNDTIAAALLPLHPDYCKLKMCATVNVPYCQTLASIKSATIAQTAERFTLDDIIAHDILIDSQILDSPRLARTWDKNGAIDSLAFVQTICGSEHKTVESRCAFLLWNKTPADILNYPSQVQDEYYKNLIRLYTENREYRLGNAMHDNTLVPSGCGPCSSLRLQDYSPADSTLDTSSTATPFFDAVDSIKVKGSSTPSVVSTAPRVISSKNTFTTYFADNFSAECKEKVDAILRNLENCQITPAGLTRLRDTLTQRFCRKGNQLRLLTPDSLQAIMDSLRITRSSLCNSWLPNLQMLYSQAGSAVQLGHLEYKPTFYENIATFIERYSILNFIASDSTSKSISARLCDDYPFEQDLVRRLGQTITPTNCTSATSVFIEKDSSSLPMQGGMVGLNLQYGTATVRLYLYPEGIHDTNRLNDTFGKPHVTNPHNYKAQSLFQTYGFDPVAATYANRNTILLSFDGVVDNAPTTLRYYLSIFNKDQDYTMLERDEKEYLNGVGCSELRAPLQSALATADSLNLKAGHPLFEKFLQNKLNYEKNVNFSYENYEEAIRTCALTDSLLIKKHLAHFRVQLPSNKNTQNFINDLHAIDTIFFSSIHIYKLSGFNYLLLDVAPGTPKSFKEVRETLESRVQALGGTTETLPALGRDTLAQLLSSSFLPLNIDTLRAAFPNADIDVVPVNMQYYRPGLPMAYANSSNLITIIDATAGQASSYTYNHYVDSICRYVNVHSPITPIFTHAESGVSAQYNDWQMSAWRAYVNTLSPANHNLLVKQSKPEQFNGLTAGTGSNTFSTADFSYQNKQYPYYRNDLYINTDTASGVTYNYIRNLLKRFGSSNRTSNNQSIDPILIPTPTGGFTGVVDIRDETRAFVCGDSTVFWINHFSEAERMYNIFIKLPPYLVLPRSAYQIIPNGIRKGFERDSITYMTLTLAGEGIYNSSWMVDTIECIAYCDRSLGQSYQIPSAFLTSHSNSKTSVAPLQLCEYENYKRLYPAARIAYTRYRDSMRNVLVGQFRQHIIDSLEESLDIFGNDINQGLTLYYYDVAGNLIKTVAPAGVKKLSVVGSDNDTINAYRLRNELDTPLVPAHNKVTTYRYNAQNKVVATNTPDAGITTTQYDLAGRVTFSQTAQQTLERKCTYYIYDKLSRVIETGQCTYQNTWGADAYTTVGTPLANTLRTQWRSEVVATLYDKPSYPAGSGPFVTLPGQENLKNRVAAVKTFNYLKGGADPLVDTTYNSALHYSYDVSGNVKTLIHDLRTVMRPELRIRRVDYEYDLYSGKVLLAAYNRGGGDQFFQQYDYDADNRITGVKTSTDGLVWDEDARYTYYDHGPLARTSLGENRVQGIDYAYTINGWLKAINGAENHFARDMGRDGDMISLIRAVTPTDVFSQRIDYFQRDYRAIGDDSLFLEALPPTQKQLFNGNIAGIASSQAPFGNLHSAYRYDPLQRIKSAQYDTSTTPQTSSTYPYFTRTVSAPTAAWASDYSYDPDGNLTKLRRMGSTTVSNGPELMDSLAYFYKPGTNRLRNVQDYSPSTVYKTDLPHNVGDTNLALYDYDANGQLTKDVLGGVREVRWNRFGKVGSLLKADGSSLGFTYDGLGNRVSKLFEYRPSPDSLVIAKTTYVRDAGGNTLAVYEDKKEYDLTRLNINDLAVTPIRIAVTETPPPDWVAALSRQLVAAYRADSTARLAALLVGLPQLADYVQDGEAVRGLVSKLENAQLLTFARTMPGVVSYGLGGKTIADEKEEVSQQIDQEQLTTYLEPVFLSGGMRPYQQEVLVALREADIEVFNWFCSRLEVPRETWDAFPGDTTVLSAFNGLDWDRRYELTQGLSNYLLRWEGVLADTVRVALCGAYGLGNGYVDFVRDMPWSGRVYEHLRRDADRYIAHRYNLLEQELADKTTIIDPFEANGVLLDALAKSGDLHLNLEEEALVVSAIDKNIDQVISLAQGSGQGKVLTDALGKVMDQSGWLDPWFYQQKVLQRDRVYLSEHHLYGSSRLGMQKYLPSAIGYEPRPAEGAWAPNRLLERRGWYSQVGGDVFMESNYGGLFRTDQVFGIDTVTRRHLLGNRHYELSDHLGNVRATVLDKTGLDLWTPNRIYTNSYAAQVSSAVDYYPFGQPMPGRSYGDSISKCVPVQWQVWVEGPGRIYLEDTKGGNGARALARQYGTEGGNEDSLGYLSGGGDFRGEVLQVYHSRERKPGEEPAVVVAYDRAVDTGGGVASTVGYKLDLREEPSEGVRVFLGVPVAVEGDGDAVSLRYRLEGVGGEEEVVAQVRVRQYEKAGVGEYYPLLDWRDVGGSGEQELQIPIDRERVLAGGRTYVEWRFARRGGGEKFDEKSLVSLEALAVDRTRWGWYTRTVMSCEQEDNYRFGFNGQEKVNEIAGVGNHNTALFWEYDTRLGRRWNLDPVVKPSLSGYSVLSGNPIWKIDPKGDDDYAINRQGKIIQKIPTKSDIDRLVVVGNNGKPLLGSDNKPLTTPVGIDKGIISGRTEYSKKGGDRSDGWRMDFGGKKEQATATYNFLADHTGVEYSLLKSNYKNGQTSSSLFTSHQEDAEPNGAWQLERNAFNIKIGNANFSMEYDHNHPNRDKEEDLIGKPSSRFTTDDGSPGDVEGFNNVLKAAPDTKFQIRERGHNRPVTPQDLK